MQFTRIRLAGLNTVDLKIKDASYNDEFILVGVQGIGPADVDVTISRTPDQAGYFQNKVAQNKQIIITVGLNPAWVDGQTPTDLRQVLYGLIVGGLTDRVRISLMNGGSTEVCYIYGYVSKMETVPFQKDQKVQITFECLSPYFSDPSATYPDMSSVDNFNPDIENVGDAPTGFYAKITFSGLGSTLGSWELSNLDYSKTMRWVPPVFFDNGDWIEFSTVPGNRFCNLHVDGTDYPGLGYLSAIGGWHLLKGGVNQFHTSDENYAWTDLNYVAQFQGP